MEYEQALIIGKRRRTDAALALGTYVRERATEVCAVKPARGAGLDARDWEPVGEENFKELCARTGPCGEPATLGLGGLAGVCRRRAHAVARKRNASACGKGRVPQ